MPSQKSAQDRLLSPLVEASASIPTSVRAKPSEIGFQPSNEWTTESGKDYVVINELESFEPFFLNIVGPGNQWLFCGSNGALSAGRQSSETALFPYYTVDKIMDNWNTTGPWTAIVCDEKLWNPFRPSIALLTPSQRRIMKSPLGDEVVFDELHKDLSLRFTYRWQFSNKYGFVRRAKLTNEGSESKTMRLVDGLDNFLPSGVDSRMQLQYSCLTDAYKVSELECGGSLLVHRLAAGITDEPTPLECLKATTVWAHGLGEGPTYMVRRDAEQLLRAQHPQAPETLRARRGAMFLAREITLAPGESRDWIMVAEIDQTQGDVSQLQQQVADPAKFRALVMADVEAGEEKLRQLVASSDGFQETADRDSALYHYQNTLSNILRGGVPENGYHFRREQFIHFLTLHNKSLVARHGAWLNELPATLNRKDLLALVLEKHDADLLRLTSEYLPLVLSRRHGDPSRPWNRFFIRVEDDEGKAVHHFEGNWRDIFQNWEALALSYPDFLGSFISKFLNASTVDGFNPYRISSEGVDWEAPDEDDPWASIGYWGDHQIVYLLKLLELARQIHPNKLAQSLDKRSYVFTDVPYRLKSWQKTLKDPRDTVEFSREQHDHLHERKAEIGADGFLLRDKAGEAIYVTLAEKLLIPASVKLANLVPGGGIWMNTQRPEWNDANNALAGCGLSVVTACYLYRYLSYLEALIGKHSRETLTLTPALTELIDHLSKHFSDPRWQQREELSAGDRFSLTRTAGLAAERHRQQVYQEGPGFPAAVPRQKILSFLTVARIALESTLRQNRREDGLWHSYNVLNMDPENETFTVDRLPVMLEGQVAILSANMLEPEEALAVLEALPNSDLRSQRHPTYLLYPDRQLPRFLEKNHLPSEQANKSNYLKAMVAAGDSRILVTDPDGSLRFHSDLSNGYALSALLDQLAQEPAPADLNSEERGQIEALYESVFHHRSFTGRSGSMFGYEGLGCVYWHMVSKLMLAAQEVTLQAADAGVSQDLLQRLTFCYYSVQSGLGFRQSARQYGAFPSEPYSHSPSHAGAQQPGLTGQVKEGILARFGELGVRFREGRLSFRPRLLRAAEFRKHPTSAELTPISFTLARVPIRYLPSADLEQAHALVKFQDGREIRFEEATLDEATTLGIIQETKSPTLIEVSIPSDWLVS